ncbi:MAG TPA: HypC/HybG/HupF family hydrogenase formation chaperone [Pirellulaceae bacterium]|nr:HypC/HybG/HupF family hydrogenase formation chaperone [Pirellulaceae bacterium]HMO94159.1 HypC/HybG/HupF family hydrogenase formation chaperone [Pirellulaceae bacterium]HMP71174.1 HypC/HybG/HupF family hydrogenase formation chaperone [Pirellulaceae bacterium]
MCLAVPGEVKTIYVANGTRMGVVSFGGVEKEICFAYLPDLQVGDYTIVHVGFAISRIDEVSAQKTLDTFAELGLLDEELEELRSGDWLSQANSASLRVGEHSGPTAAPAAMRGEIIE